jgi:nicotinamidase-related amidase
MKHGDLILVTDMQNVYTQGQEWACLDTEGISLKIADIAAVAKERGADVCLTRFMPPQTPEGTWKEYNKKYAGINANSWLNELVPTVKELTQTFPVYDKSVYSSLSIPQIREAARTATRVVLTGVVAECCVLWTAVDAIDLGCKVIYLTDAVSGFTRQKEEATELIFEGLSPLHILMMNTEQYLGETD